MNESNKNSILDNMEQDFFFLLILLSLSFYKISIYQNLNRVETDDPPEAINASGCNPQLLFKALSTDLHLAARNLLLTLDSTVKQTFP